MTQLKQLWMRLSSREKILVGLAFFALLLVLTRFLVVSPFLERRAWVKSQLEVLPELRVKNIQYLDRKEAIENAFEKAQNDLKTLEHSLLSGDTASVSASNLQEMIQTLAAKEGTQIITTRVLNPEASGKYTKIPIQIELSGEIEQVANLLKSIASAEKLLVVDELNIRSLFQARPPRAREAAAIREAGGRLRVRLIVSGITHSQQSRGPSQPTQAKISKG